MSKVELTKSNLYVPGASRFDIADYTSPEALKPMGIRMDAADSAFFLRELAYVYEQTFDLEFPELKATKLIPVDSQVDPGADTYLWHQFDKGSAEAAIIQDMGADFPNADVKGKEFGGRVYSAGVSYQYTLQELRASAKAGGKPLDVRRAEAARFAMEQLIDRLGAYGVSGTQGTPPLAATDAYPTYGLTNNPSITAVPTTTNWIGGTATVAQILADVNKLQATIFNNTLTVHMPDTLVLPTKVYSYLATTPRSPTFTDDTMLQYILKSSPWLKTIEFWQRLDTAGLLQDDATVGPRIMMYKRDPKVMSFVLPLPFEQLPPQMVNLSYKIPCHARVSGVTVRYPLAVAFMDGATG